MQYNCKKITINTLPYTIPLRVVYFAISYILICIGIALSNRCKLPIIPTDLFPREVANIAKIGYPKIKVGFDITCLTVTAILTFFFLGHLDGIGIGTILAAFTTGKVVGIIGDKLDCHFNFQTFKTLKSTVS